MSHFVFFHFAIVLDTPKIAQSNRAGVDKGSTNFKLQQRLLMRDEIKNKTITMTTLFTETLVIFLLNLY